jgi:hypothetical protein
VVITYNFDCPAGETIVSLKNDQRLNRIQFHCSGGSSPVFALGKSQLKSIRRRVGPKISGGKMGRSKALQIQRARY